MTNIAVPTCAAAEQIYRRGIAYAIATLSLPNVYIYVDGAHAGWLGWPEEPAQGRHSCSRRCWTTAGGADRIRGFALNVSNYDPPRDPNGAKSRPRRSEPGRARLRARISAPRLAKLGVTGKGFIIDTSRNGKAIHPLDAGQLVQREGRRPRRAPGVAPVPNIDAYFWIKTPGESDGTTDPKAARFDENCVSDDAMPGAPEAGELFAPYLIDLAKNADPPL